MRKWQNNSVNKYLVFGLRVVIGLIFVIAGLSKTTAPIAEFIGLARQWNILPEPYVTIYAFLLPWVELVFGLTLLFGAWSRLSAFIVLLMLLSFLIAIGINISRGTLLQDCGCFGGWFELGATFQELFWRDAAMFVGTLWIMFMPKPLWLSVDQWLTS
ncbi:MAG: MauE/DoxX family redox-associated membrane protein [Patescibacteria group bacterium]|jgi:uncharacterized membrane protein YphA (DoxX/SURF4 family)